jgi:hypothetical protein
MTPCFETAARIGDAVMYEGYILYPYRASALKNRFRWQFGVFAPRALSAVGGEASHMQTECLLEAGAQARVAIRTRCLQLQRRTVEQQTSPGVWEPRAELRLDDRDLITWDEAVPQERDCQASIDELCGRERLLRFEFDGRRDEEPVRDRTGEIAVRWVRQRWPVTFDVHLQADRLESLIKLRVRIENVTEIAPAGEPNRDVAIRRSLLGCHAIIAVEDGAFVSLLDPPASWRSIAETCRNEHTWPVLVGADGSRSTLLSAPIILYDYPTIAPESRGDYFDATEIDELLALRVATLTDDERRAALATDERAAEIVQRTTMEVPADHARLHGTFRQAAARPRDDESWESLVNGSDAPGPHVASIAIGAVTVAAGSHVRLVPKGRADAIDMFLIGRTATVAGIFRDLEDRVHVAVTVDDDPAADLQRAFGRYWYFSPDEIVPLTLGPIDVRS